MASRDEFAASVDRMLDYRAHGDDIRGFSRHVSRLGDVAQYVIPIADFGRGVSTFAFELPPDMTPAQLCDKFAEFVQKSAVFTRPNRADVSPREFNMQSLTRLGDDGYVGVYECGADSRNQYMLVVQSYDTWAADTFQSRMMERVHIALSKATNDAARVQRLNARTKAERTLPKDFYQETQRRSNINRRFIAACFFAMLGISVRTERCKANEADGAVVVVDETQMTREYKCTFLREEGHGYMRVYNWVYTTEDLLSGAPWHMCMHEGLRVYYGDQTAIETIRSRHVTGAPMGVPHLMRRTYETNPADADAVRRVVFWQAPLETILVADPALRVATRQAVARLEDVFTLRQLRFKHWRTICVGLCPPDDNKLSLKDVTVFGTEDAILVSYEAYPSIVKMWNTLTAFHHSRKQMAHAGPHAAENMPPDAPRPTIRTLFQDETPGGDTTNMERGILRNIYLQHDAVLRFLDQYVPGHDDDTDTAPSAHEFILERAESIKIPAPSPQRKPMQYQSEDDPLVASDADFSTDLSDSGLRIFQAVATAHTMQMRGRARAPKSVAERKQRPTRAPADEDDDDEFYDELGVVSDSAPSGDDAKP